MDSPQHDPTSPAEPPPTDYGTTRTAVPPAPGPRRFRRSNSDRMVAGVAGGLADAFAVDPVVIRVLLGVLTFFGGAGLVIYGVCWLLMPDDDREVSWAERALRRDGSSNRPALALAAILGVATLITMDALFDDHRAGALIALVVVAAILLARRQNQQPPWTPPPTTPGPPGVAPTWSTAAPATDTWSTATPATDTWTTAAPPAPGGWAPLPPLPPATPRERSILGRLTVGVVLVALGLLAAADLAWADVPAPAYPAVVLAGAGLGLLLGTRYGRARGLIALGLVGALALPVAAFAEEFDGDWDAPDQTIAPVDVAGILPEYSYRAGEIRLDLSNVDFTGRDVATEVRLGAGNLVITVPSTTDVHSEVDLGLGAVTVFDSDHEGWGVDDDRLDSGPDGPGGGMLDLTVIQGAGKVEVRRASS